MKKFAFGLLALIIFSCKKEYSHEQPAQQEKPDYIELSGHQEDSIMSAHRTSAPMSGENVIFLDFDGQGVTGTNWNVNSPINAAPSTLGSIARNQVVASVKERYSTFDVIVTTDSTVYWNANPYRRIRAIITPTWQWYGSQVGGVAFVHSFIWGSNEVCWVFDVNRTTDNVAVEAAHEVGHTLGLYHQSIWTPNCQLAAEYNPGGSVTPYPSWAPTMGVAYGRALWTFTNGHNNQINPPGCTTLTDEYAIINTTYNNTGTQLPNRPDGIANDVTTDVTLGNGVAFTSQLEYPTDVDFFQIPSGHWSATITVTTFGTTDIAVDVCDASGVLKETVNPSGGADVQSTSVGGVIKGYMPKYIAVRNTTNNPNVPAGSLRGTYTITVTY